MRVDLDPERLQAYSLSPLEVQRALAGRQRHLAGRRVSPARDAVVRVDAGRGRWPAGATCRPWWSACSRISPVFLKDVAHVRDGPAEVASYVRHGWGPARGFGAHAGSPGTVLGSQPVDLRSCRRPPRTRAGRDHRPGQEKGHQRRRAWPTTFSTTAEQLKRDVLPDDVDLVVTRNYGLTADEKVNELVEALGVAILIVIALLTLSLGWRAALVVAVAIPVVFGLTLAVNLLFGYTINRVTLFALILSLGLLVDDPIVDVENIARHFEQRRSGLA